jgi:hypothetical protein
MCARGSLFAPVKAEALTCEGGGRVPVLLDGTTPYATRHSAPSERDMAACHRWQREEFARCQFVLRHGALSR